MIVLHCIVLYCIIACSVLLRVHVNGLVALSQLSGARLQTMLLLLRLRQTLEDRHPRSSSLSSRRLAEVVSRPARLVLEWVTTTVAYIHGRRHVETCWHCHGTGRRRSVCLSLCLSLVLYMSRLTRFNAKR